MQEDLLTSIMDAVSRRLNHDSFNIWFKPISAASIEDSVIYLTVPNEIFGNWIRQNYLEAAQDAFAELGHPGCDLKFIVNGRTYAASAAAAATTVTQQQPQPAVRPPQRDEHKHRDPEPHQPR